MKSSTQSIDSLGVKTFLAKDTVFRKASARHFLWVVYIAYLISSDIFMTTLAFRLAYTVRFQSNISIFRFTVVDSLPYYSSLSILLVPVWLLIFSMIGLYKKQNLAGGVEEYHLVGRATVIGMLVLIVFGFLKPEFIIARGWLLFAWMFSFLFVAGGRFLLRRGIYLLRRSGYFVSPAVIVGANEEGISLARQLLSRRYSGLDIIGFVDKKLPPGMNVMEGLYVLGPVESLDEIITTNQIEELILASSAISTHDKLLEIFQRYGVDSKVNVRMSSGLYEIITTGLTVKEFAYVPMVCVNKARLTGWNKLTKQLFDYCVTIPVLVIAFPLLAIIGIAIKLDSPGPIIHRRRVMGVNGREFYAYKFRTMYVDGDTILACHSDLQDELARNHKLKNDPRVTKVGRIVRKFSLDELPQLLNVIFGQMSLVGPRMISPREMRKYSQWGINLLTVKPGITGLWQVSGRSDISYEERVRLDMHYIRNWSIWLDLQLLWRTLPAVLMSHGAY